MSDPIENLSTAVNQAALNVAATSIANKDAYKWSTRYADYTNDINLANWRLQNQRTDWLNRNAASIQKQALIDAGLSPASMNESDFSGAVSDVGSPAASMPGHSIAMPDLLAIRNQSRQLDIQQQIADAETSLKAAQEKQALASAGLTSEQQVTQQKVNEYYDRLANLNIQEKGAVIGNLEAQKAYTTNKNAREDSYLQLAEGMNKKQMQQIDETIKEIQQRVKTGIAQAYSYYCSGDQAKAAAAYSDAMAEGQKAINRANSMSYQWNGSSLKGYEIPNLMRLYDNYLKEVSVDTAIMEAQNNINKVNHQITYDWSNFAVNTAEKVSQESRKWAYGWIPLTNP